MFLSRIHFHDVTVDGKIFDGFVFIYHLGNRANTSGDGVISITRSWRIMLKECRKILSEIVPLMPKISVQTNYIRPVILYGSER